MSDLLQDLTATQQEAVRHREGPCLVVAGAGTGKTTVITRRIAYLIQEHAVSPDKIVALTFTDKAAREMEERLDVLLPYGITDVTIATFHSFCADLLKRQALLLGLNPAARLLTTADEVSFLRQHLEDLPTGLYRPNKNPVEFLRALTRFISTARDECLPPDAIITYAQQQLDSASDEAEQEKSHKLLELGTIYKIVEQLYRDEGVLAYGDLLYYSYVALRDHPSVRKEERERFSYILVDEFQDTNTVQNEIIRLLAAPNGNLMVVGDDDQAIYSFRGANLDNILSFSATFPERTIITLVDNFRSSQPILDAAYHLIQHNNPERLEVQEGISKQLRTHQSTAIQPVHWQFSQDLQEYQHIAQEITRLITEEGYAEKDIAILLRSRAYFTGIQRALDARGINNQFAGDLKFYAGPVVQEVLSFLRFLTDAHNDLNLFSCLTRPPFSLSERLLQKELGAARYSSTSLYSHLTTQDPQALDEQLASALGLLQAEWGSSNLKPTQAFLTFLTRTHWYEQLRTGNQAVEAEQLSTLYDELSAYEIDHPYATVSHYIQHIDYLLATEEEISLSRRSETSTEGVQIMTIHKSKGLEFRAVFIPSAVHGRFPSRNLSESLAFPYELALHGTDRGSSESFLREERRLAYVAITRAKERLYFTSSLQYEERKTKAKPSQFIAEALGTAHTSLIAGETTLSQQPTPKKSTQPLPTPSSYSASSLETYEQCPQRYQYQYVLQIPVPASSLSNFGTSIHETLKAWFTARKEGHLIDIEELYAAYWIGKGYENKRDEQLRYAEGLARLKEYITKIGEGEQPTALEMSCKAVLPSGKVVTGKIDRLDQKEHGLRIIDYKTSDRAKKPRDLIANIPLAMYSLAMQQRGLAITDVELQFVMTGERVGLTTQELAIEQATQNAEALVGAIGNSLQSGHFPAKPDKIVCAFCDYRSICPFRYGLT